MLHINNPQYADERTASKPLSLEEQKIVVELLNAVFKEYNYFRLKEALPPINTNGIQLLFYHYENLQALSDFVGGWDGARKLTAEWVNPAGFEPEDETEEVLAIIQGEYLMDQWFNLKDHPVEVWRPLPPKPLVKDKD